MFVSPIVHSCIYVAVSESVRHRAPNTVSAVLCVTVWFFFPLRVFWSLEEGQRGSNSAAGSLAVLAVVPQSSTVLHCCVAASLLNQAWSQIFSARVEILKALPRCSLDRYEALSVVLLWSRISLFGRVIPDGPEGTFRMERR